MHTKSKPQYLSIEFNQPVYNLVHPRDAFSTGGALPARFVLVEHDESSDGFHYVSGLVHDYNGSSS